MNSHVAVTVIVEGQTELIFVKDVLAPYLGAKNLFMTPIVLSKPGQKGGDVRFVRAKRDIAAHLKQRKDTYVSLLVDYYGMGPDWPGLEAARQGARPKDISAAICQETQAAIDKELAEYRSNARFVPYISVHEFEALLFSDAAILATALEVDQNRVKAVIEKCGEPEAIDNSPQTAPSKRIEQLRSRFKKTTDGIAIAKRIGIDKMRSQCPLFDEWVSRLESLSNA